MSSDKERRIDTTGWNPFLAPYMNPGDHVDKLYPGQDLFEEHPEMKELIGLWLDFHTAMRNIDRTQMSELPEKISERAKELCAIHEIEDPNGWSFAAILAAAHTYRQTIPEDPPESRYV